jgi:hypothetical protein
MMEIFYGQKETKPPGNTQQLELFWTTSVSPLRPLWFKNRNRRGNRESAEIINPMDTK